MKIEAGKYYRTRDGRKVGPMKYDPDGRHFNFSWADPTDAAWRHDGIFEFCGKTSGLDLIAEWRDETPAHILEVDGREYDLTALETPPFLLPDEVYDALAAWPHGYVRLTFGEWVPAIIMTRADGLVHRAKPAPVEERVECYRGAMGDHRPQEQGTCIKRADGTIDWTTWEPLTRPTQVLPHTRR